MRPVAAVRVLYALIDSCGELDKILVHHLHTRPHVRCDRHDDLACVKALEHGRGPTATALREGACHIERAQSESLPDTAAICC